MRAFLCGATVIAAALGLAACGPEGVSSSGGGGSGGTTASGGTTNGGGGATNGGGGATSSGGTTASGGTTSSGGAGEGGRGFPVGSPWVSFYGSISDIDAAKTAATFRILNIDADPDGGNTKAEIEQLKAGGQNRVISYINFGSCESFRTYYDTPPAGHASCVSSGALTTPYDGYPDEMWADLSNTAYRDLLVNYVAPRLVDQGVDGFFLDNLEVVEHGANDGNGPCDAACSQGGLDLVWELRQKFPDKLIVMQNATSDVTLKGTTHGVAFPTLLDGISHEEVYSNGGDAQTQAEMQSWRAKNFTVNGVPFWIACEEYVGSCSAADKSAADALYAQATADGLNAYVTDASASQQGPCFWSDF
ncbi:MAG: endo alpha-1,4 polygalactosaminidase [Polyangiaceae bacterium]